MATATASPTLSLSPLSSLPSSSSSAVEIIPDSDSAAPLPCLSSHTTRPAKRPRLTLSPEPPAAPHQPTAAAAAATSASQDVAFLHQLDLDSLDWQPSSDPQPVPHHHHHHQLSSPHPRPRPPLHLPSTTTRDNSDASRSLPTKSRHPYHHHQQQEEAADDSGVFLNAEELHLSQDIDLAGGDDILLALGAEEGEAEFDGAGEEDEMWAGFDEPEVDEAAGMDVPPPPKQDEQEMDYREDDRDGFDFSLGPAGTQAAAADPGWDPNMLGGFQLASRKPVKLSAEALRRAKRLLEAEEEGEASGVPAPAPAPAPAPIASTCTSRFPTSFATASGRAFPLPSAVSLAQASTLLSHSPNTSTSTSTSTLLLPLAPILPPAPPPPAPLLNSRFTGFTTASGAPVAPPSEAALAKARGQVFSSPPPAPRAASQIQNFGGFQTAAGGTVEMPSEEAMERARKSAGDVFLAGGGGEGGGEGGEGSPAPRTRRRGEGAFKLPGPAAAAGGAQRFGLDGGGKMMGMESPTAAARRTGSSEGRRTPLLPVNDWNLALGGAVLPTSPQPHLSSPAPAPPVSISRPPSRTRDSTVAEVEPVASTCTSAAPPPPPPARRPPPPPPPPSQHPNTSANGMVMVTPLPSRLKPPSTNSTAFRSPLLSSTTSSTRPQTPTSFRPPLLHNPTSTPQKPPTATPRRLNLGMTPRARPAPGTPGSRQKKFETPFKGGRRPEGLTPLGVVKAGAGGGAGGSEGKGKGKGKEKEKEVVVVRKQQEGGGGAELTKLFDLTPPPDRLSLSEFGMRPQTHYYESCERSGVPADILSMTLPLALAYIFPSTSTSPPLSHPEAHAALLSAGANPTFATPAWVKNHYGLIVWKLASYVRSRPDLVASWWKWEKVVEGLKYRYEREVNQAHRSAIKRIQEQDSPSTLPMVLCVSQLRWDDPPEVDPLTNPGAADQPLVIVGLELTDGWYRVRTNVDGTLKRAVERGKVVVGSKVVVVGAKIDSSREGTEVLEALGKSSLIISANSTTLAPWSTKLGFISPSLGPFIASLSSLTSSGGVATLLDVVVEKAFPCGFVDLGKGGGHGTWNEEEERTRKDEWVKGRAKAQARLADEMEKTSNEWEEIIELLQDCVQGVGAAPTASPSPSLEEEEPDEILDRLEGTSTIKEKEAIMRTLSPRQANGALALAGEMSVKARYAAQEELEKELATAFPPRDVRGFRVLRIKDARVGSKPFTSKRTAQLTVWDADSLGPDFFVEGSRYFVTNVIPKGSWKRQSEEITLATRRDSRWRAVVGSQQD